ncbi:MAG: hypothetical protein QME96_15725 [Myxococcota bacterium]|nr:hypothetical protein [Myxococcota bacterium]
MWSAEESGDRRRRGLGGLVGEVGRVADELHRWRGTHLRGNAKVFGIALLATCVLPWAFLSRKTVFLWTLLDEAKGAGAFFLGYTVVAGLVATALAFVSRIPPLARVFRKGVFHFRAAPRARCTGRIDGRVT